MSHFNQIITKMQQENIKELRPRQEVCEAFTEHADLFHKRTAWTSGCRSWFKQGKIDGPLAMWPGSRLLYFDCLAKPRYEDYHIKYTNGNPFEFMGNGFTTREYNGGDLSFYLGSEGSHGALLPKRERTSMVGGTEAHKDTAMARESTS